MWDARITRAIVCLGLMASFAVLLPACGGKGGETGAPAAASIKLSYSIFFPPTHLQCITADEWAK